MQTYKNWQWSKGPAINATETEFSANIEDSNGNSWYYLMEHLDTIGPRWVVGVQDNGYASWATNEPVSGKHVPSHGSSVVVLDDIPEGMKDGVAYWKLEGDTFVDLDPAKHPVVERTKEDILSDLIRLQEELKAL